MFCSISLEFKIDDNFFIYNFQSNLGPNYTSDFERYEQNYASFNIHRKAKYNLSSAIEHYQSTVKNPSAKHIIGMKITRNRLLSHSYTSYPPLNITQQTQKV